VVAGDVARLVQVGVAGCVGEAVPEAASCAVSSWGAFDLVSGRGGAPQKAIGELIGHLSGAALGLGREPAFTKLKQADAAFGLRREPASTKLKQAAARGTAGSLQLSYWRTKARSISYGEVRWQE
jgi:hypothetical protein